MLKLLLLTLLLAISGCGLATYVEDDQITTSPGPTAIPNAQAHGLRTLPIDRGLSTQH